jgi:REP element-mobilizing transposase RayT
VLIWRYGGDYGMPRGAREKSSSGIYHIMLRGINKQVIFNDEEDFSRFIYYLGRYKKESDYKIYSYCLMNNHIHLILKENSVELESILKRIAGSYAQWYNRKYSRVGHLFQDRFKSKAVEDERYLFAAMRYIHMNPVKDNISKSMENYVWSSYSDYLYGRGITDILGPLKIFSNDRRDAIQKFIKMHMEYIDEGYDFVKYENIVSDDELITIIQDMHGINIEEINSFSNTRLSEILKSIQTINKVGITRMAKITGINRLRIIRLINK